MCRLLGIISAEPIPYKVLLKEIPRSLSVLSKEHSDGWGLAVYRAHLHINPSQGPGAGGGGASAALAVGGAGDIAPLYSVARAGRGGGGGGAGGWCGAGGGRREPL